MVRLKPVATLTLTPTAPFHFDGTVFNPSHFPARSEAWVPGCYWQSFRRKRRTDLFWQHRERPILWLAPMIRL